MARTATPSTEDNPFLTGTKVAPVTGGREREPSPGLICLTHNDSDLSDNPESSESVAEAGLKNEAGLKIDASVQEEMEKLEDTFQEIGMKFRMIDRIGEGKSCNKESKPCVARFQSLRLGTFSTVYKAEDLHYDFYQNDWDVVPKDASKWMSPPVKRRKYDSSESSSIGKGQHQRRQKETRFVAIKKIYVTSSPMRIQNELELLHDLRGCRTVCPLITAFRHQDQVVAVLPYFRHQDFRVLHQFG